MKGRARPASETCHATQQALLETVPLTPSRLWFRQDYPSPIVDHAEARDAALAAFNQRRGARAKPAD